MKRVHRHRPRLTGAAALWLLAACSADTPEGPSLYDDRSRVPAVLAFYGDTATIEIPAATRVGEATTVRFTSFAGGCIRQDATEADVAGLSAEIRPFRRDPSRIKKDIICTMDLRLDTNVVELRFAETGRARVRIVGLAQPGDHRFVMERDIEVTR